jgi:prepilin-type processing-associated H-X9-DG protein
MIHRPVAMTVYNHAVSPNGPLCDTPKTMANGGIGYSGGAITASSWHPGGVNVLMCDGQVRSFSDSVDANIWSAYGTRRGGEVIDKDSTQ